LRSVAPQHAAGRDIEQPPDLGRKPQKKRGYFRTFFTRLTARRGPRKAIAATMNAARTQFLYTDLGADLFERPERTRLAARRIQKLAELGFHVSLADQTAATTGSF
jgi:hypothetical protein